MRICYPHDRVVFRFSVAEMLETQAKYRDMGAQNPTGRSFQADYAGMAFELGTGHVLPFSMYRVVTEDPMALASGNPVYIAPDQIDIFAVESRAAYPDALIAAPLSGGDCVIMQGLDGSMTPVALQCLAFADEAAINRATMDGVPMGPIADFFRQTRALPTIKLDNGAVQVTLPLGDAAMPAREMARNIGPFFEKVYESLTAGQGSAPVRGLAHPAP